MVSNPTSGHHAGRARSASETAGAGDGVHQLVSGGGYVHGLPWSGLTGCRTELVEVLVGWAAGLEQGTPRSGG
jgi:hypothetical protein